MMKDEVKALERVRKSLTQVGALLHSDSKFPSLVSIVAEGPIRGSWWGHPKSHLIFQVAGVLARDPDVLVAKLISGKETYIHRRLWPPFLAIATSKESWQMQNLTPEATSLLHKVELRGELQTHKLAEDEKTGVQTLGEAARELEHRLLIYYDDIHTESGFHAKLLKSWQRWSELAGLALSKLDTGESKTNFDALIEDMNQKFGAKHKLPWNQQNTRNEY